MVCRGTRFSYTYYYPEPLPTTTAITLSPASLPATLATHPIHASISALDHEAMTLLTLTPSSASKAHDKFTKYLARTKNSMSGQFPIQVLLAAIAEVEKQGRQPKIK